MVQTLRSALDFFLSALLGLRFTPAPIADVLPDAGPAASSDSTLEIFQSILTKVVSLAFLTKLARAHSGVGIGVS